MLIYIFIAFMVPRNLVCDFRGDLSRMEIYKTLPLDPWRICAGQLVVQGRAGLCDCALTIIASALVFEESVTILTWPSHTGGFCAPANVSDLCSREHITSSVFPTKLVAMGRADFEFLGRSIVEFIAKTFFVFAALAASGAAGLVAFKMMGTTLVFPGIASWLALTLIGLLTLVALQYAFRRFAVAEAID